MTSSGGGQHIIRVSKRNEKKVATQNRTHNLLFSGILFKMFFGNVLVLIFGKLNQFSSFRIQYN
jgi:hypothetical protein